MPQTSPGIYLHPKVVAHIPCGEISTIVELGAGDGRDSVALNAHFGAPVYCFECNPDSLRLCAEQVGNHPDIHLVPKAAWNETKPLQFFTVVNGNPFASSCLQPNPDYPFESLAYRTVEVPAVRLDEWLASRKIPQVDLLCIDVQGACLQALEGMGEALGRVKYIIAELGILPIYRNEALEEQVTGFLRGKGFEKVLGIRNWLDTGGRWVECLDGQAGHGTPSWFADFLFIRRPSPPGSPPGCPAPPPPASPSRSAPQRRGAILTEREFPVPEAAPGEFGAIPSPRELAILCALAAQCPGNILEIGCNLGNTTRRLATSSPTKTVYGIDFVSETLTMCEEQAHEAPRSEAEIGKHAAHLPNTRIANLNSADLDYARLTNVTMIFIDGDHSYAGVKTDSEKAIRYLTATGGGLIVWHDYYPTDSRNHWVGVKAYIDAELAGAFTVYHFKDTWLAALAIGPDYERILGPDGPSTAPQAPPAAT